ncbi:hypothetical protein [Brevundimonas diminuta]|uniref:hypothetical protein n=1 Tax=Brevundimonas diminuta TaxID=293 RepID=UPI003D069357
MTDAEVEVLRLRLLEIVPRLERRHMLELADALHDAARERRWNDGHVDFRI